MNNHTCQGEWKQRRRNLRAALDKLTTDGLLQTDGNADRLTGTQQESYGYTKEKAQTVWHKFV